MREKTYIVELTERERELLWHSLQDKNARYSYELFHFGHEEEVKSYFERRIEENRNLMNKLM